MSTCAQPPAPSVGVLAGTSSMSVRVARSGAAFKQTQTASSPDSGLPAGPLSLWRLARPTTPPWAPTATFVPGPLPEVATDNCWVFAELRKDPTFSDMSDAEVIGLALGGLDLTSVQGTELKEGCKRAVEAEQVRVRAGRAFWPTRSDCYLGNVHRVGRICRPGPTCQFGHWRIPQRDRVSRRLLWNASYQGTG